MQVSRELETDVLVVGGGGAGERSAYESAKHGVNVLMVIKGKLGKSGCTTRSVSELSAYSAALGHADPRDNPSRHYLDTIDQGGGLSNQELVRIFALEAPRRLLELVDKGMVLKKSGTRFEQLLADASTLPRACHNGADTGREIARVLQVLLSGMPVTVMEDSMVVSLLKNQDTVVGALVIDGNNDLLLIKAKSTILATGGGGQTYALNAQPPDLTGDGLALALRAGADLVNMEFIQFGPALVHPLTGYLLVTRFWTLKPRIYNKDGVEFLNGYLPMQLSGDDVLRGKEFAFPFIVESPGMYLDVAMHSEISQGRGTPHGGIYMDISHNDPDLIAQRVPVTFTWLLDRGIDLRKSPIEIAPVAQCFIGGVKYNQKTETNLTGLYVCGEVSGGAHGAARPGGNLLAISQVFGARAGNFAARRAKALTGVQIDAGQIKDCCQQIDGWIGDSAGRPDLQEQRKTLREAMWRYVSCVRTKEGLGKALEVIQNINNLLPEIRVPDTQNIRQVLELSFMTDVATMVAKAAMARQESRGTHYRVDYPSRNNHRWLKVLNFRRVDGQDRIFLTDPRRITDFYTEEEEEIYG